MQLGGSSDKQALLGVNPPAAAGYGAASTAQMVAGARRTPADLAAFLELHIEQVGWNF